MAEESKDDSNEPIIIEDDVDEEVAKETDLKLPDLPPCKYKIKTN